MALEVQLKTFRKMCVHSKELEEILKRIEAIGKQLEDSKAMAEQIRLEVSLASSILSEEDVFRALNNISLIIKNYLEKYGKK